MRLEIYRNWSIAVGVAAVAASMCSSAVANAEDAIAGSSTASVAMLPSCIEAGPPISITPTDSRVMLDVSDRDSVVEEMVGRYPRLQQDGFEPAQILLLRNQKLGWVFVSLARASATGPVCFTATFSATGFESTRSLIQKYFFAGTAEA